MATHTLVYDGLNVRAWLVAFAAADITYTFDHEIACPIGHAPLISITHIAPAGVGIVVGAQAMELVDETQITISGGGVAPSDAIVWAFKPGCDVMG